MNKFKLLILGILFSCKLFAQDWTQVGAGLNSFPDCMTEYNNELYIGGSFTIAGGMVANGLAKWNGTNYFTLGATAPTDVKSMCVYKGELYVAGQFSSIGSVATPNGIAKWNGTIWSAIPMTIPGVATWSSPGGCCFPNLLKVWNNKLIIAGATGYLFSWDSIAVDTVPFTYLNSASAITVYNGDLYGLNYLTGKLSKWNSPNWTNIEGLTTGSVYIKDLLEYNSELYITGDFGTMGGITVNNIAKWNGITWSGVGVSELNGGGWSMCILNNELYVGGSFFSPSTYGHLVTDVLKWNGSNWNDVSQNTRLTGSTFVMGCNNDIYAVGIGVDSVINNLAWLRPSTAGVNEINSENKIHVFPNPSSGQITFSNVMENGVVEIMDITGKLIVKEINRNRIYTIDLSDLDKGIYFFKITNGNRSVQQGKLIIQ